MAGPQFIKYFPHVISALKDLGNSGTPPEVRELIAEKMQLSEDELNEQMHSGASRFDNHNGVARNNPPPASSRFREIVPKVAPGVGFPTG